MSREGNLHQAIVSLDQPADSLDRSGLLLAQAQQPNAQPPAAQPPAAQPAVQAPAAVGSFNIHNGSLLEVIDLLAQDLHINYVLDSSVKNGSVTINTYGPVRPTYLRPLLETILRMNNLAMVQVDNIYRIIPAPNISHQPIDPISQTEPSKFLGMKLAPMPSTLCVPGAPPPSTEPWVSTATVQIRGSFCLR